MLPPAEATGRPRLPASTSRDGSSGFTLPFSIENCPEYVAVDVRATEGGYILHFVNYNPATQIKGIKVRTLDGQAHKVLPFNEYNYIKI